MGISYHHARHAMEVKNNHDAIAYPIVNPTVDVPSIYLLFHKY